MPTDAERFLARLTGDRYPSLSQRRYAAQMEQRHARGEFPRNIRSLNEPHHD